MRGERECVLRLVELQPAVSGALGGLPSSLAPPSAPSASTRLSSTYCTSAQSSSSDLPFHSSPPPPFRHHCPSLSGPRAHFNTCSQSSHLHTVETERARAGKGRAGGQNCLCEGNCDALGRGWDVWTGTVRAKTGGYHGVSDGGGEDARRLRGREAGISKDPWNLQTPQDLARPVPLARWESVANSTVYEDNTLEDEEVSLNEGGASRAGRSSRAARAARSSVHPNSRRIPPAPSNPLMLIVPPRSCTPASSSSSPLRR